MKLGETLLSRSEVLGLLAVAGSFRAGSAIAVINQPRLPPLDGPYEVGCRLTRVNGARTKLFYPAAVAGGMDAPYCTDGRETSDGMAGLVGFRQLGLSFLLAHLATATSGCWLNAPPLSKEPMPLLVYSHGFGGNMDMASYMMRAFASHGAVVACVEHTDGTASSTRLQDGTQLTFSPGLLSRREQLVRRADELLAAAAAGALGDDLPPASGLYLGGHSYGGPSALLAVSRAPQSLDVSGLLLHDPALGMNAGIDSAVGSGTIGMLPALSYVSDEYDRAGVRCGATLHTVGGFHGNFVDACARRLSNPTL
jgi:pimeloyl-ACP methyl ester carboxylesterase|uniref:1-alkyl-2-acetylglycerophosphocholine esterase n=1 Tax=Haptolina ericina TaxID=156174 RepID=A0A7S3AWI7_9EUKA|mmetsp:Transcript_38321/g.87041  ORF Transcript_38321/g.87041 Transcript_38321/m.87041 type:complete len:310 (+) Transcript_38321:118-1047(+)